MSNTIKTYHIANRYVFQTSEFMVEFVNKNHCPLDNTLVDANRSFYHSYDVNVYRMMDDKKSLLFSSYSTEPESMRIVEFKDILKRFVDRQNPREKYQNYFDTPITYKAEFSLETNTNTAFDDYYKVSHVISGDIDGDGPSYYTITVGIPAAKYRSSDHNDVISISIRNMTVEDIKAVYGLIFQMRMDAVRDCNKGILENYGYPWQIIDGKLEKCYKNKKQGTSFIKNDIAAYVEWIDINGVESRSNVHNVRIKDINETHVVFENDLQEYCIAVKKLIAVDPTEQHRDYVTKLPF